MVLGPCTERLVMGDAVMPQDFFGLLYVELERASDQIGWLRREEINPAAWLAFLDMLKAEVRDGLLDQGVHPDEAADAMIAAAMQVAWVGAQRWAANSHSETAG